MTVNSTIEQYDSLNSVDKKMVRSLIIKEITLAEIKPILKYFDISELISLGNIISVYVFRGKKHTVAKKKADTTKDVALVKMIDYISKELGYDITQKRRFIHLTFARYYLAHYLKKNVKNITLYQIAEYINLLDHSTVIHALNKGKNLYDTNDDEYMTVVKKIKNAIENYQILHFNNHVKTILQN